MLIRIVSFALSLMLLASPVLAQVPNGPGPSFFFTGTQVGVATATSTTVLTVPIVAGYVTAGVHCRVLMSVSTGTTPAGVAFSLTGLYGTAPVSFLNALILKKSMASAPLMLDIYLQQSGSVLKQELWGYASVPQSTSTNLVLVRGALTQTASGPLNLKLNVKWASASVAYQMSMNAANCSVGS